MQIIANLYKLGQAGHRTLLVAHSNAALNDLFEKIMERDIDERYPLLSGYSRGPNLLPVMVSDHSPYLVSYSLSYRRSVRVA